MADLQCKKSEQFSYFFSSKCLQAQTATALCQKSTHFQMFNLVYLEAKKMMDCTVMTCTVPNLDNFLISRDKRLLYLEMQRLYRISVCLNSFIQYSSYTDLQNSTNHPNQRGVTIRILPAYQSLSNCHVQATRHA